jgi:hypothetical protein
VEVIILAIFLFIGIVTITAVIFGGWVILSIARLIGRVVGLVSESIAPSTQPIGMPPPHLMRCDHANCRADNPKSARFCRRCGKPFQLQAAAVSVRRKNVWCAAKRSGKREVREFAHRGARML